MSCGIFWGQVARSRQGDLAAWPQFVGDTLYKRGALLTRRLLTWRI
jgi:hypothetical protein